MHSIESLLRGDSVELSDLSDCSDPECRADALFQQCRYSEAADLYRQIAAPTRRVREKLALCLYSPEEGYPLAVLGAYETETSPVGLLMQAYALARARHVDDLGTLTLWLAKQDASFCECAFAIAPLWLRFPFSDHPRASEMHSALHGFVCQHAPQSQMALQMAMASAIHSNALDTLRQCLDQADLENFPILATLYRAALKVDDKTLATGAVRALAARSAQHPDLSATIAICALELGDWSLLALCDSSALLPSRESRLIALAQAADAEDHDQIRALIAELDGDAMFGLLPTVREAHTLDMTECETDTWSSAIDLSSRLESLLAAMVPGELRGKFIARASLYCEGEPPVPLSRAKMAYKDWPAFETAALLQQCGGPIAPTALAGHLVSQARQCAVDDTAWPCYFTVKIPTRRSDLSKFVRALDSAMKKLPDTYQKKCTQLLYDEILESELPAIFGHGLGGHVCDCLERLHHDAALDGYALPLAFTYQNIGRHADARAIVTACPPDLHDTEAFLFIRARIGVQLDDRELLAQSKQAIEAMPSDHPARSHRVEAEHRKVSQRLLDLAGTQLHVRSPEADADAEAPIPVVLDDALTTALAAIAQARSTLDTSALITLQIALIVEAAAIRDVLSPASADQRVFQQWNALHPGFSLAPHGEQTLHRLAKKHGHAQIVMAMDENAVRAESDPDLAMRALLRTAAMRSTNGTNRFAYLSAVLKNRLGYLNSQLLQSQVLTAARHGVDLEDLIGQAKEVISWSAWREYIAGLG